jgi:hypothetical protein
MKYLLLILSFGLMSCGSQKINKTQPAADFSKENRPYAQTWSGGAPGSGRGVNLYLPASIITGGTLQAVYFRGQSSTSLTFTDNLKNMTVTKFTFPEKEDRIMSSDPKDELGNEAPELKEFPFPLADSEAVIAVDKDGATQYIKITGIEDRENIPYPSMRDY